MSSRWFSVPHGSIVATSSAGALTVTNDATYTYRWSVNGNTMTLQVMFNYSIALGIPGTVTVKLPTGYKVNPTSDNIVIAYSENPIGTQRNLVGRLLKDTDEIVFLHTPLTSGATFASSTGIIAFNGSVEIAEE